MVSMPMLAQAAKPFFRRARYGMAGMKQKRLQRQRKHMQMYKQRRNLLALQKQEQRRERTALAVKSKRIVAKYKAVVRRAAQVAKEIQTKQKSADEQLLRLYMAEQKKRLLDYANRLRHRRMQDAL